MKLGEMNLNNVPLGQQGAAPIDTGVTQLGNKVLDAFIARLAHEDDLFARNGKGGGSSMRDTLEMIKLVQDLQGTGERQTAKDAGFSDMAGVFSKLMENQMGMMKEMYHQNAKKEDHPPEKSEADKFFQQLAMQMVQGSLSSNPRDKIKDDLQDLVSLQKMMGTMVGSQNREPSSQERLMMRKLDLEIEKIKAETAQRQAETSSQNDLYATGIQTMGDFFRERRTQRDEDLGRTADPVTHPPTPPAYRLHCRSCGHDVLITGPQDVHFCPVCGRSEHDDTPATPDDEGPSMAGGDDDGPA